MLNCEIEFVLVWKNCNAAVTTPSTNKLRPVMYEAASDRKKSHGAGDLFGFANPSERGALREQCNEE